MSRKQFMADFLLRIEDALLKEGIEVGVHCPFNCKNLDRITMGRAKCEGLNCDTGYRGRDLEWSYFGYRSLRDANCPGYIRKDKNT